MSLPKIVAAALLATAAPGALAATGAAPTAGPKIAVAEFTQQADALLASAFPVDGPGAAVIVTRGGKVIYAAGRGLADIEAKQPITPDSLFKLGSIAKQFTAATVLKLVEQGKLSLDDPLSRFFPDFPQPAARATVRQLLNHTSGVNDYSKIPGWIDKARERSWTTAELVAEVRDRPAETEPGASWEYNNAGYMLLGAIVEQVTGKSWYEALRERITAPLGLESIGYAVGAEANPAMVHGYTGGESPPASGANMSVAHAAGGLVGNVKDLAKWAQALHHGKVVQPEHYAAMTSPARLADGSTQPYGFGLRLQRLRGQPAFVHGGAGRGLDTDSVYIPSQDLFVAVFANADNLPTDPAMLTRRLAALAMGEPFPILTRADVDIADIEPLFGQYLADDGEPLRFFSDKGTLRVGQGNREREVFAAGGDRFFFGGDGLSWFRFIRKPDGAHVIETHRPDNAEPQIAVRSGPVPTPFTIADAVLISYVGTFQTETRPVVVALGADGRLTITAEGWPIIWMRPVSETEFHLDGTPMRVVFHPELGKVDRLTIHRGARELHGKRIPE